MAYEPQAMLRDSFFWTLPGGCALVAVAFFLTWRHHRATEAAAWAAAGSAVGAIFTLIDLTRELLPQPLGVVIAPLQWLGVALLAQAIFVRHGFGWNWPKLLLGLAAPTLVHFHLYLFEANLGVRLTHSFLIWGLLLGAAAFRLWTEAVLNKPVDWLIRWTVTLSASFYLAWIWSLFTIDVGSHSEWRNNPLFPVLYIGNALAGLAVALLLMLAIGMDVISEYFRETRVDPLTGIGNRRAFDDAIAADGADGEALGAVLIVDLDRFKAVNDELGHDVGDAVLISVARSLNEQLGNMAITSRIGGEEFAVLIPSAREEAAHMLALVAHSAVKATQCAGLDRQLTCSIGLARRRVGEPLCDTMRRADMALYQAKAQGRDRIVIAPEEVVFRAVA